MATLPRLACSRGGGATLLLVLIAAAAASCNVVAVAAAGRVMSGMIGQPSSFYKDASGPKTLPCATAADCGKPLPGTCLFVS